MLLPLLIHSLMLKFVCIITCRQQFVCMCKYMCMHISALLHAHHHAGFGFLDSLFFCEEGTLGKRKSFITSKYKD